MGDSEKKGLVVEFKAGTQAAYNTLSTPRDPNTFFICEDSQRLFIGDAEYSRPIKVGTSLPTEFAPPYSLFYNTSTKTLYYSDGSAWHEAIKQVNIPSLTKGTDEGPSTTPTQLSHGGEFNVLTDTKVSGHTITDVVTKFKLPTETQLSKGADKSGKATLPHGGTFTATTGIEVNGHQITETKTEFTLPTVPDASGSVTGGVTKFVKSVSLTSDHTLSGDTQEADAVITDTSASIPTSKAVKKYVDDAVKAGFAANDAMVFKGTLGTHGTVTALPTSGYSAGWTYRVIEPGTYAGVKCEVGDMIVCVKDYKTAAANSDWSVVQTNIDGAVTSDATLTANALVAGNGSKTVKVASATGSETKGIYIDTSGVPQAMSYSLNKDVPSNAVFTDTNTAHNHSAGVGLAGTGTAGIDGTYTYKANLKSETAATEDSTTSTTAGKYYAVGVDKSGHLAVNVPWTDNNTEYGAGTGLKLTGTTFDHKNSVTANTTGLNTNKTLSWGSAITLNTVKYDAEGHISGTGTYTITMPANPNTDTHWTAKNVIGTSAAAKVNAATTNTTTFLNLVENDIVRSSHQIKGTGSVSVTADANGVLTITGTDTDTHWTSKNVVGASASATQNAAATNGNVYLNHVENGIVTSSHKISGAGDGDSVTVTSDGNGNITVGLTWGVF